MLSRHEYFLRTYCTRERSSRRRPDTPPKARGYRVHFLRGVASQVARSCPLLSASVRFCPLLPDGVARWGCAVRAHSPSSGWGPLAGGRPRSVAVCRGPPRRSRSRCPAEIARRQERSVTRGVGASRSSQGSRSGAARRGRKGRREVSSSREPRRTSIASPRHRAARVLQPSVEAEAEAETPGERRAWFRGPEPPRGMRRVEMAQRTGETLGADLLNPFVHRLELDTTYDKLKTAFLTVALLPFRLAAITALVIMAWLLACLGLHGLSEEDLRRAPLTGWRRKIVPWLCFLGRLTYQAGGMRIVVHGRQASRAEAPILVVAPHSTFMDGGIVYVTGFPSIIVRRESGLNPFIGKLINYTQPVYVWREDPNSRQNTIKEIIERATSKEDWPQVMIFPEGTCTNRSCLITFKSGAFYPGVPVQPVCIKYPNKLDTVTWTWEGPGALKLLWLTLTQLNSSCEIEFLPVYKPSEEEKTDPKLYANNVRRLMAEALEIPVSDYTYDDCRIIGKAHRLNLPNAASIVEAHKLRYKLGLLKAKPEEELLQGKRGRLPEEVDLHRFATILRLDEKEASTQQLFRIHDKLGRGKVDLQEYVFTVLVIANADTATDMLHTAFEVCDSSGAKRLTMPEFRKALRMCLQLQPEEADKILNRAGSREVDGDTVSLEDAIAAVTSHAELAHLFAEMSEAKRKKTI
ncbi:lysophosphatidylcholine acyltransferase isoform X2 [Orussus abietinus]|uniref:lysophosphatidylcholine acyltransferase isoform X2 n=1 Tax=Orussus abietinus TaxID=222816 RepID=UPI0006266072|nr:lysophosphatidylcholine acyltransferase isoform X2 [Orussus abietinus]